MTASASVLREDIAVSRSRFEKSERAFRTISEVASELDVAQHVLRFWESKFSQVRPVQRAGGRRYYRPEDVDLLRRIRSLLYEHGYSIKGVQRLLKERRGGVPAHELGEGVAALLLPVETRTGAGPATNDALPRPAAKLDGSKRGEIENVLADLQDALELLRRTLRTSG